MGNKFRVPECCSFLIDTYGFKEIESRVSHSFDNAFIVLQSKSLYIRFVRDRGDVTIEVSTTCGDEDWQSLNFIRIIQQELDVLAEGTIPELCEFLKSDLHNVTEFLWRPESKQAMEEFRIIRGRRMFPGAFPT